MPNLSRPGEDFDLLIEHVLLRPFYAIIDDGVEVKVVR